MSEQPEEGARRGPGEHDLLSRYGGIVSRDTAIYVIAMASVFPASLLQLAVFTRVLDPAEYGQLALLMFFASLVTIVMNLVTLQGSLMVTYGQSGDDGDDGLDDGGDMVVDEERDSRNLVRDKQLALSTGVGLMLLVMVGLGVPLALLAPQIGDFLLREPGTGDLVLWALVSGIAGSLYRFFHNLLRMERRPWLFVGGALLRPPLVVGLAIYFVLTSEDVTGALIGTAAGSGLVALLCMVLNLRMLRFAFSPAYAKRIAVAGAPTAVMHVSLWLMHNADTFFLSRYSGASEVGLYRMASRLASIPTYFVSAYTMAFPPLERTALMSATYGAYDERGGSRTVKSYIFTYFIVCCLGLIVGLAILADALVLIAGPEFRDAANLIPILAISYVSYGFFTLIIRFSKLRRPRTTRIVLSLVAVLIAAGLSPLLIPPMGAYGAALAIIIAMFIVDGILLWMASRSGREFRVQWWRVGGATLAAVVAWAVGTRLTPYVGPLRPLVELAGLLLYPALLLLTGAVPLHHLATLREIARRALPRYAERRALVQRVEAVPARRRAILEAVILERRPAHDIALAEHVAESEVHARLARAVRQVAGQDVAPEHDARIGEYLMTDESAAVRDTMVRQMIEEGIDAFAIHEIETTFAELQRARPSRRALGPAASIAWPA